MQGFHSAAMSLLSTVPRPSAPSTIVASLGCAGQGALCCEGCAPVSESGMASSARDLSVFYMAPGVHDFRIPGLGRLR